MATEAAREVAARFWCDPRTSDREMDPALAEVIAEKLDEYADALIWCSGNEAFCPGGKARRGWLKVCKPLLQELTGE